MNERELVNQFYDLFDGNRMAVGTEQGGCLRLHDAQYDWVNHVYMHLADGGENAIGVYPLRYLPYGQVLDGFMSILPNQWYVKWGCVDFDDGEDISYGHARNLQQMLAKFGVTAWLERSRSKGWHAWVFADKWEPAWVMRRGLLMACTLVGAPTREINPKAEGSDDPSFLGNYIRLVYPGGFETSQHIMDARESGLACWPNGGRGELLSAPAEGPSGVHRGGSADDRQGHRGAGAGGSRDRRDGLRRAQPQPSDAHEPRNSEPQADLHVAGTGDGGRLRSDRGAVPLAGNQTPRAGDSLHTDVPSVGTPQSGFRRVVLDASSGAPYTLEEFVRLATERRGIQGLYKLAEAYKPPAPVVHHEVHQIDSSEVDDALGRCRGLTKLFIDEGPRDRGRSEWLFILGNQLVKDGLHTIDEMVALLAFADAQHGEKFTHRRDAELRYSEIIDKALAEL